jgi:hypothetical protein
MLYNRSIELYHLLENTTLIKLSCNQILTCADYFILDKNLHRLLLSQYRRSIHEESFFSDFFINKKNYPSNLKTLLVVKQVIANILNVCFKKSLMLKPFNFQVFKTNIHTQRKLDKALKDTNFSLQLANFTIGSKVAFTYILKVISSYILDKKFYNFLKKFFLIKNSINIKNLFLDKSSKLYQVICNIYLLQVDTFIGGFFKKHSCILTGGVASYGNLRLHTELLAIKALTFIQNHCSTFFKHLSFNNTKPHLKTSRVYYIRYFQEVFFAVGSISKLFHTFRKGLIFFCKSTLCTHFTIVGWSHLKKAIIKFCGFYYKIKDFNCKKRHTQTFVHIKLIKRQFKNFEIIHKHNNKPIAISYLLILYNDMILSWYNYLIFCLKAYYSQTQNYKIFLNTLFYILKWSLFNTLKQKHKKSLRRIILQYSSNIKGVTALKNANINFHFIYKHHLEK